MAFSNGTNLNKAVALLTLPDDIQSRIDAMREDGVKVDDVLSIYYMPKTTTLAERFDVTVKIGATFKTYADDDTAAQVAAYSARTAYQLAEHLDSLKAKAKAELVAQAKALNEAGKSTTTSGKRTSTLAD